MKAGCVKVIRQRRISILWNCDSCWHRYQDDKGIDHKRKVHEEKREALTKAKELLMKLEPEERFVVGTAPIAVRIWGPERFLNLSHLKMIWKSAGLSTGITKRNSSESCRLISEAGLTGLMSISLVMCDGKRRGSYAPPHEKRIYSSFIQHKYALIWIPPWNALQGKKVLSNRLIWLIYRIPHELPHLISG